MTVLNGTALDAEVETGEVEIKPGRRSMVTSVRPYVSGGTTTVQVGYRNDQSDSVTYTGAQGEVSSGFVRVRKNARFHRFRANITGGFSDALGFDVEAKVGGQR
jgi:hypothetical protein